MALGVVGTFAPQQNPSCMRSRSFLFVQVIGPVTLLANNIQVSNVALTGKNTTTDTYQVQFDIGWENSWRTSTSEANCDAAWIFMKYRLDPSLPWVHATLGASGHVQPSGSTIQPPVDLKGAFLFRSADGLGNVNFTGVQLQWNYGATSVPDNAVIELRVYAIEMVFIPQGSFAIGDGTSTGIDRQFEAGQTGVAYTVGSEGTITLGGSVATNLNARNNAVSGVGSGAGDDFSYSTTQSLPAGFPKGFNAFYLMKYECTEQQYADFLNTLPAASATVHFPFATGQSGNSLANTGPAPEIYVSTAPERAAGFIRPFDALAYADWAALRPMTEFEYEKSCRGSRPVVVNEYAWGGTALRTTAYVVTNAGTASETVNAVNSAGNSNYAANGLARALRSGVMSGSVVGPDRSGAGAGYLGAMDLSGNLREMVISVGASGGRAFTGLNGDGDLPANGVYNVANWPALATVGFGLRGGGFSNAASNRMRVSDRMEGNVSGSFSANDSGFRLVRQP